MRGAKRETAGFGRFVKMQAESNGSGIDCGSAETQLALGAGSVLCLGRHSAGAKGFRRRNAEASPRFGHKLTACWR
jgi:hypothetical protein